MISPEGYAKLTNLLCAILLNQEELAHMIYMAARDKKPADMILSAKMRIDETCRKALKPISESPTDKLSQAMAKMEEINNAEEKKLVTFFRSAEGDSLGREGDHDNLSPAETAIRAMRELLYRK